jgi:hypothetical protein
MGGSRRFRPCHLRWKPTCATPAPSASWPRGWAAARCRTGFRVDEGPAPVLVRSADFAAMATQLRRTLRDLLGTEAFRPEQVAVLSPYRHTNPGSAWAAGLDGVQVACSLPAPEPGRVRVGTIQGFKGLESDVVILAGIDSRSLRHPATLYVGASRARALLLLLALDDVVLPVAG